MPSHNSFEFAVYSILGIPLVITRHAVPSQYGSPGTWVWSRWRLANFGNAQYANMKLRELNRCTTQTHPK